jgi:hypothetical protein
MMNDFLLIFFINKSVLLSEGVYHLDGILPSFQNILITRYINLRSILLLEMSLLLEKVKAVLVLHYVSQSLNNHFRNKFKINLCKFRIKSQIPYMYIC